MDIAQDFIPVGRRNRPGHRMAAQWITVHDTGNARASADAQAHARYLKGDAAARLPASWHFTVDDKTIIQHLPLDESGWHAGDGARGAGNRQSIGIEICENRGADRTRAEDNAAWLVAKLLADLNLPIGRVVQHHRWNGKDCPHLIRSRAGGWEAFIRAVWARMRPPPQAVATPPRKTHTVVAGDTVWALSRQYGVTVAQLQQWNGLVPASVLRVGQALHVEPLLEGSGQA